MGFAIQSRAVGRVVVIDAVGKFTSIDGHTKLRDLVHVLTGSGTKNFVINMERVEFVDSSGIGELLRSYFVVRQRGGEMKLACLNAKVLHVLTISRMNTVFEIHAAEDAALKAFGG